MPPSLSCGRREGELFVIDPGRLFAPEGLSGRASRLPASLASRSAARPAARSSSRGGGETADREKGPKVQHRQSPLLGVVPSPIEDPAAADEAWGLVLDGIAAALRVPNLPSYDFEKLVRCQALAAACCRQPHLARAPALGRQVVS